MKLPNADLVLVEREKLANYTLTGKHSPLGDRVPARGISS
jgi:hypothetical protein